MSLSDLAALGSFVSGVAVLASLGFLYFQMRQMGRQMQQTERNQKSLLMQQRMALGMDAMFRSADPQHAPLTEDVEKNPRGLSPSQLQELFFTRSAFFLWVEDAHYQYMNGALDKSSFEAAIFPIKTQLSVPYMRAFWYAFRRRFAPGFVEFVDAMLPEIPLNQSGSNDMLSVWNGALDRVEREMKSAAERQ
jgi:hypothetical protein